MDCRGDDLHNPRKDSLIALDSYRTPGNPGGRREKSTVLPSRGLDVLLMVVRLDIRTELIRENNTIFRYRGRQFRVEDFGESDPMKPVLT